MNDLLTNDTTIMHHHVNFVSFYEKFTIIQKFIKCEKYINRFFEGLKVMTSLKEKLP